MATFYAWAIVSAISDSNAHAILRSSIGLYATQLPSWLIMCAIYTFFTWISLFFLVITPAIWRLIILALTVISLVHIVSTYSALGNLIMKTR